MNHNKKVLQFVCLIFGGLLALSIYLIVTKNNSGTLQNINILADVLQKNSTKNTVTKSQYIDTSFNLKAADTSFVIDSVTTEKLFKHFAIPNRITAFAADSNAVVLDKFIAKLLALKKKKKGKIRIAYLGDSMIEGDFVSQTLRKLLQQNFGGGGVGFVPVTSNVAMFRSTVRHSFSTKWLENNFKNKISVTPLYLSGKNFFANGYNWMEAEDKTYFANAPLKKYLLHGYKTSNGQIAVNSIYSSIKAMATFNRQLIDSSNKSKIKLETSDNQLPIYGITFETEDGVVVDNFSFRGSGGFEFVHIDSSFLQAINATQPYDLIIMQYGVNVLNKPFNNSFNWYYKAMVNALHQMKACFTNADFLLISSADKSFKYSNGVHTAIGMDSLIATQEKIAFDSRIAFFNTYNSMGGYNSMITWANSNPQLAAKDFTHLNAKGAEILGTSIYNALMYEANKMEKR